MDFNRPPARYVDVGHTRLAYRTLGTGPDLVLVHGWPLTSATFRQVAPLLARSFRVHLFDLPGAGHTLTTDATPYGLAEHASTLRAAIDELGLTRYGLVAHDSGGVIARLIAADDPRVFGLVLAGSEIPGTKSPLLVALFMLTKTELGRIALRKSLAVRALRQSILGFGSCFHDVRKIEGEFADLFAHPLATDDRWAAGQMQLVNHFDWEVIEGLARAHRRIAAPTLLLWGDDDPYFPIEKARGMAPQFGGPVEISVIDRARLFPHEEHPEIFAERSAAFLVRALDHGASVA